MGASDERVDAMSVPGATRSGLIRRSSVARGRDRPVEPEEAAGVVVEDLRLHVLHGALDFRQQRELAEHRVVRRHRDADLARTGAEDSDHAPGEPLFDLRTVHRVAQDDVEGKGFGGDADQPQRGARRRRGAGNHRLRGDQRHRLRRAQPADAGDERQLRHVGDLLAA